MIFSPDLSVLYVSVPKTGCTTIKAVVGVSVGLIKPEVLSRRAHGAIHRAWRSQYDRRPSLDDEERDQMLFGKETFRFTSVRNPYERLVSCYLNKIADGRANYHLSRHLRQKGEVTMLSFLRFVANKPPFERDIHCQTMVDLCYYDRVSYDDIVRYEYFEENLKRVMEKLNVSGFPIPQPGKWLRTDAGSHVHELLGAEESSLIRTIYDRDFDEFGYSRALSDAGR